MASHARLSLRALVLVVALLVAALATATATARRTFDFNADGTFKIVQLADMHYSAGELATCRDIPESAYPCSDRNTTDFIGRVLDVEQPDLAVYTGDNLDRPESVAAAIEAWAAPCIERGIPWAAILGNHDDDRVDLNRRQIMDVIVSLPYAVSEQGPADVYGASNYLIQLLQPATGNNSFNLWFFDSAPFATLPNVGEFDWVRPSQLSWYEATAAAVRDANGGTLAPAIAFFHIPIQEYNETVSRVGDQNRAGNPAKMNGGLFASFKAVGDVRATFVGHDHTNDFCGVHYDVALCYGGSLGYGISWGLTGWPRRSRVIQIEDFGGSVRTWKRLDDEQLTIKDEQVIVP